MSISGQNTSISNGVIKATNTQTASLSSDMLTFSNAYTNSTNQLNNTLTSGTGATVTTTAGIPDIACDLDMIDVSEGTNTVRRSILGFCDIDTDGTIGTQYPTNFVQSVVVTDETFAGITDRVYQITTQIGIATNINIVVMPRVSDFTGFYSGRGQVQLGSDPYYRVMMHNGSTDSFAEGPFTVFFIAPEVNL